MELTRYLRKCSVIGCVDNTSKRHRLPKSDPNLFDLWVKQLNNPVYINQDVDKIYKNTLVCHRHFKDEFKVPGTRRGLTVEAYPTLYLPPKAPEAVTSTVTEDIPSKKRKIDDSSEQGICTSSEQVVGKETLRKMSDSFAYVSPEVSLVDVFGNRIVGMCDDETGDIYVNIENVKKTGFVIFKENEYRRLERFKPEEMQSIMLKQFYMSMLGHAKKFLLDNMVSSFDSDTILQTIERCRTELGLKEIAPEAPRKPTEITKQIPRQPKENITPTPRKPKENTMQTARNLQQSNNVPANFVPTNTQRFINQGPNNLRNQNQRNGYQQSFKQRDEDNMHEPWAKVGNSKAFDSRSVSSDSSNSTRRVNKSLDDIEPIEKTQLDVGKTIKVKVAHIECESKCWVQKEEDCAKLNDMLLAIDNVVSDVGDVKDIVKGQLALAEFEGIWCRCRVLNVESLKVFFIDYGNKEIVTAVKNLPDKFKEIPAFAVRICVDQKTPTKLDNDMELLIKVIKKYDDGTHLVSVEEKAEEEIKMRSPKTVVAQVDKFEKVAQKPEIVPNQSVPNKPKEDLNKSQKVYKEMPKPFAEINNGDKVMLLSFADGKFGVKTKECVNKGKETMEYIKSLNKNELILSSVEEGQLVLCSKDGLPSLYRAIVTKKNSPTLVLVKYLDTSGEDQVSIKSLRNIDEYLSKEPVQLLYTPKFISDALLNENTSSFITELLENKEKAVAVKADGKFDLKLQSGKLFTEVLSELSNVKEIESPKLVPISTSTPNIDKPQVKVDEKPKEVAVEKPQEVKVDAKPKEKKTENVKNDSKVFFNDMPFKKLEVGTSGKYLRYSMTDFSEMTIVSMNEEDVDDLEKIILWEVNDEVPYEPEAMEMCMVLYCDGDDSEATWNRAVVMDVSEAGFLVSFVDFGTTITVPSKVIRKFPEELKNIPMLGILSGVKNIPNNDKTLKRFKEIVKEGEDDVLFKICEYIEDEMKYIVEIPEVYAQLKKEGLI